MTSSFPFTPSHPTAASVLLLLLLLLLGEVGWRGGGQQCTVLTTLCSPTQGNPGTSLQVHLASNFVA